MSSSWSISQTNINKFQSIFHRLEPTNNKLSGEKIKQILLKSELSNEVLAKLWSLSDIDKDGYLDKDEFILIMHLIQEAMQGRMPSDPLPSSIIPPCKRSLNNISEHMLALPPSQSSNWQDISKLSLSVVPKSASPTYSIQSSGNESINEWPEWSISPEDQNSAYAIFCQIDTDADSLISGLEVKDYLNKSGLSNEILAKIWGLVDLNNSGKLNREQFALVIHLIHSQINKAFVLPNSLPPRLIPPSLRPPVIEDKLRENSRTLLGEIEKIKKQNNDIFQTCSSLENESVTRLTSIESLQAQINKIHETNNQLSKQKLAAESVLKDYEAKISNIHSRILENQEHVKTESNQLLQMKNDLDSKQFTSKKLEAEIEALRQELIEVGRQEAQIKRTVNENQSRHSAVKKEIILADDFIQKISQDIDELLKTQKILQGMEEKKDNGSIQQSDWIEIQNLPINLEVKDLEGFKLKNQISFPNVMTEEKLDSQTFPQANNTPFLQFPIQFESPGPGLTSISTAFDFQKAPNKINFDPFDDAKKDGRGGELFLPFEVSSQTQKTIVPDDSAFDPFASFSAAQTKPISGNKNDPFSPIQNSHVPLADTLAKESSLEPFNNDPFDLNSFSNSIHPLQSRSGESKEPENSNTSVARKTSDPPPRPPAISIAKLMNSPTKLGVPSETDQLKWAQADSERLAIAATKIQRQEEADFELALKLSLQDK